jgi:AcrR family transcriptional regulator
MGISERRERQRAELRDLILRAAARIMAEEGFAALTMRKIAEAIEYSAATIYLHFESRDQIAMQLVRDGFAAFGAYIAPGAAEPAAVDRLKAIGRRYVAFSREHPQTYRLIFMEDERFAEAVLAHVEDGGAFDVLVAAVRAAIEAGTVRRLEPELVAGLLWAALHGIASLKISCSQYPFPGELDGPTEAMLDVLFRGLAPA